MPGGKSCAAAGEQAGPASAQPRIGWLRPCRRTAACPAGPCTRSRRTGHRPEYVRYEDPHPAHREHAPDPARPPSGRRRQFDDRT
ncbi:hypothetical protein DTB58_36195 [Streptomyces griseus]|nr:hypothetical protein [Streptomyces griseus]